MTETKVNANEFGKIGGTTISAILGLNPWNTAHDAYLRLRREAPPTPDNEAMARGRRYEPIVAEVYQGAHPEYRVAHNRQGTDAPETYEHPDYPFLIGHPDRLLYDAKTGELVAGLEIKTSNLINIRQWGEEYTDEIPKHYLLQCQWYAGLAKLPEWRVIVAFLDDNGFSKVYREYVIKTDYELFDCLVAKAVDFWKNNVLAGVAPPLERVDETTKLWLNQKYPINRKPLEKATPREEQLMAHYLARKQELERAQQELEKIETELKLAIGDRDGLESETFGKVTWKTSKDSTRIDYKAIVEELKPEDELIAKHTKQVAGSRRFVTTGMKIEM